MTELLILKDKLQNLYARYDMIISHVLKFAAALVSFLVIRGMTGYNATASNMFVLILLSAVCAFLPGGVTALAGCVLILLQLYGLAVEYAAVAFIVLAIMLLVYFIFSPKTSYVLLLVPIFFIMRIPYAAPVVVGMTAGLLGIVPAVFGTYLYYMMNFCSEFALSAGSFGEGDFIPKLTFIMDNTILNKEMLVMSIVFAATIILVYVIKSFSMDYSWVIATVTGSVVEAILVVMSHVMLSLDFNMGGLLIGTVAAILTGLVLYFFFFSVDYSRTERVQFEDDDYYYYVKAVPKFNMAKTEVKVKKINSRTDDEKEQYDPRDVYGHEDGEVEPEELDRQRAYERDVVDLEDEE